MQSSGRLRAVFQALLVTFLWSTSWVLIKYSIHEISPLTFAGLRYTLAVIILLSGLRKHEDKLRALSGKDWSRLAVLGVVFYTITQGGQFVTLNHLEAITFSLLLNFTTVLVAVFGIIGLREMLSLRQWIGILVFIVGVLIYFSPSVTLTGKTLGFLLAGITVCANAIAALLGRSINRNKTIPPLVVTVVSMGIGALALCSPVSNGNKAGFWGLWACCARPIPPYFPLNCVSPIANTSSPISQIGRIATPARKRLTGY